MALTDAQKVEVTLRHYSPLARGKTALSFTKLATEINASGRYDVKVTAKMLRTAVISAIRQGLVRIEPSTTKLRFWRVREVETDLKRAFPSLSAAVVVQPSENESGTIHEEIGAALGRAIHDTFPVIKDHDIVALGSGRAVRATIDAFEKMPKVPAIGVSLASLTGSIGDGENDADAHVRDFTARFIEKVGSRQIGRSIAADPEERTRARLDTWLAPAAFAAETPTHAIVGMGVLAGAHRFFLEIDQQRRSKTLSPIARDLAALVSAIKKIDAQIGGYVPVSDICNRLFVVDAPEDAPPDIRRMVATEIAPRVLELNARLVTVEEEQLEAIPNVMMAAGTLSKARAIHQVLWKRPRLINALATDAETARAIIQLERKRNP